MLRGDNSFLRTEIRMINLASDQCHVLIAHKQRRVCPVAEDATFLEHHMLAAMIGDELVFAVPGRDICLFCLKEMNKSNSKPDDPAESEAGENVDTSNIGDMDSVSGMDEIIPEDDETIPSQEYGEIEEELSLEDVREDEERDAEDDEEEEE